MPDEPEPSAAREPAEPSQAGELLALIGRLEGVLARSGLGELEVEAGQTTLVLRTAASLAPGPAAPVMTATPAPVATVAPPVPLAEAAEQYHAVLAPLTGIFYSAPAPDAAPYVQVGTEVVAGQVIGLIEAMKLFNEIKCDVAGRVVRLVAVSGKLVKAKQPLIEVEPT
ncbi:MAG: acetyl-CoA carboxylase biotin carboxyl carrier protein [Candidatus Limnocylindrales bacterium]